MAKLQPPTHSSEQIGQMIDAAMIKMHVPDEIRPGMHDFLVHAASAEGGNCATQHCLANGTFGGFFGITDSTWAYQKQVFQKKYGITLTDAQRADTNVQCMIAVNIELDNEAQLNKMLGHAPNITEYYVAHFLGAGGAHAVISHPDSTIGELVHAGMLKQGVLTGNPIVFKGKGLADFKYADLYACLSARMGVHMDELQTYEQRRLNHLTSAEEDRAHAQAEGNILQSFGVPKQLIEGLGTSILAIFMAVIKFFMDQTAPASERTGNASVPLSPQAKTVVDSASAGASVSSPAPTAPLPEPAPAEKKSPWQYTLQALATPNANGAHLPDGATPPAPTGLPPRAAVASTMAARISTPA